MSSSRWQRGAPDSRRCDDRRASPWGLRAAIRTRMRASIALAGIMLALTVVFVRNPSACGYPPCVFHALTGLCCPGCGSLRALHQLMHGHLAAAFGLNPLLILMLPVAGYALASGLSALARGRALPELALRAWQIWLLLGIIIAYWVSRNIPVYPLKLLHP